MKNTGKKFLSDIKLHSDYFKWKNDCYETWGEACDDILDGHRKRYKGIDIEEELASVLESMKEMRVFASQRNLQFRGPQIERSNSRVYNCSVLHAVTNKVFQNTMFLLMNGCGVGVSLLKPFVDNISSIIKRTNGAKTFSIPDSIEGWSDAIGVLMSSYFTDNQPFPEYAGYEVRFDYSQIRPKGSYISGGYKAPGPGELKKSLEKMESFLESLTPKGKLSPRDVYDLICMSSDAVISGGVRRSALIMLVDPNDEEMIMAKTGNWRQDTPWRARSNNSVMLKRGLATKEQFDRLISLNEGDNDIGFVFVDSWFDLMNPCLSADSKILTENGEVNISSLDDGNNHVFINALGQKVNGKVSLTGYKPTVTLSLSNGNKLTCTEDHVFLDVNGNEFPAMYSKGLKLSHFSYNNLDFDEDFVKFGFIQGDGCLSRLKSDAHKGLEINLGEDDEDVRKFFGITSEDRCFYLSDGTKERLLELGFSSDILPFRKLPLTINIWTRKQKLSFLRGLWSANGCIIKNSRISFKSTCKDLIESLTVLLSEFGISSYYTTNKAKKIKFENGEYECRESYDLNIGAYSEIVKFAKNIGFIHSYKNDKLDAILKNRAPMVRNITKNKGLEPVYDFSLEDMIHVGVVNGVLTHNCAEISFTPVNIPEDIDLCSIEYIDLPEFISKYEDKFGVQFCNLTSMNAEKMTSEEVFLKSCRDAAILGTLQAGYTNFPYLGEATEAVTRREALLGVSMTGWMNNPKMFNAELLRKGAIIVKEINVKLAKKIGINPAARTTCVKPEGNLSVIAQTSSGIHPEHSEMFFRIMQLNKESEVAKYLLQHMPFLLEESVWSAFKTDYVVFVPIQNPKTGYFKNDMKGVKHLEFIKLVQENWVIEGTTPELGISKKTKHNVSSTVIIDDKSAITQYIWDNQHIFSGISFISDFGDKDFNQAPFTSVLTPEEIFQRYGKGALFASGLIVDGLHYFDGNLWQACDCALDKTIPVVGTREQVLLKKSWLDRAKKFAKNYFRGDMKNMVYCLKDVHLSHKWETINRQMKEVDFSKILPRPEYAQVDKFAGIACSSGSCEVTRI